MKIRYYIFSLRFLYGVCCVTWIGASTIYVTWTETIKSCLSLYILYLWISEKINTELGVLVDKTKMVLFYKYNKHDFNCTNYFNAYLNIFGDFTLPMTWYIHSPKNNITNTAAKHSLCKTNWGPYIRYLVNRKSIH